MYCQNPQYPSVMTLWLVPGSFTTVTVTVTGTTLMPVAMNDEPARML